uniref:Uncharacterized protein n=1 Tax=Rhizophora mucronata TaxID=61149 RepID=A0A2P2QQX8_RHIMU
MTSHININFSNLFARIIHRNTWISKETQNCYSKLKIK